MPLTGNHSGPGSRAMHPPRARREFSQPAGSMIDAETFQRRIRTGIHQWFHEPLLHGHIPAPKKA
ncbi:MAG: hypothetical protein JNM66_18125 [Bryobacterales bacterium]|nr:hypothetical protein [Bryobacterales bacterium]